MCSKSSLASCCWPLPRGAEAGRGGGGGLGGGGGAWVAMGAGGGIMGGGEADCDAAGSGGSGGGGGGGSTHIWTTEFRWAGGNRKTAAVAAVMARLLSSLSL